MNVVGLWQFPVKSMRGVEVSELFVGPTGVAGDRAHAFVDAHTGERISAKRHGALLGCAARLGPALEVRFPDGTVVRGDPDEISRRVSALLDRDVLLVSGPPGMLVDLAPVHVLATSTLRALAAAHPGGDWDPRRLRPNILVDDSGAAAGDWLSCDLRIGAEVVLHVVLPTGRCVMTTLAQGDLPRDAAVLKTIARVGLRQVEGLGERACAGFYADVVRPGVVRHGDAVRVEPVTPRRDALRDGPEKVHDGFEPRRKQW